MNTVVTDERESSEIWPTEHRFCCTELLIVKIKLNLTSPQTSKLVAVCSVRPYGTHNSKLQFLYPCTLLTSPDQTLKHLVIH